MNFLENTTIEITNKKVVLLSDIVFECSNLPYTHCWSKRFLSSKNTMVQCVSTNVFLLNFWDLTGTIYELIILTSSIKHPINMYRVNIQNGARLLTQFSTVQARCWLFSNSGCLNHLLRTWNLSNFKPFESLKEKKKKKISYN